MHPILFEFKFFTLYSFGLALALAFMGATWLGQWMVTHATKLGATNMLAEPRVADMTFWALLAGIIGARGLYVLTHLSHYRQHPMEVLAIWHGGLIFYGGAFVSLIAVITYIRQQQLSVADTCDLLIPMVPLGQSIGRVGCFLNGCCYGKVTDSPLGVLFHWSQQPRYPTQLFETLVTLLLAIGFSAWIFRARIWDRPRHGAVAVTYAILYAVWRFGIEYVRDDNPIIAGGLNLPQWISLAMCVVGGLILWRLRAMTQATRR